MEQDWELIEGACSTPGAEGITTYGVRVTYPDGTMWEWADVDVDKAVTRRLLERLRHLSPERCHLKEMVLDFIEEVAGEPL